MKYAAINTDENTVSTGFWLTEEEAWTDLQQQAHISRKELEDAYHIQGFTDEEIADLKELEL